MKNSLLLWDLAPPSFIEQNGGMLVITAVIALVLTGAVISYTTWLKRKKRQHIEASTNVQNTQNSFNSQLSK